MKKIMTLMCLTVMLRVWWPAHSQFGEDYTSGNGILVGYMDRWASIRKDNGDLIIILWHKINKSKWVEVKAERDK